MICQILFKMNTLTHQQQFIIFVLENYKNKMKIDGVKAFDDFNKSNVFIYLQEGYEVLHTQSMDYVISEVENLIKTR